MAEGGEVGAGRAMERTRGSFVNFKKGLRDLLTRDPTAVADGYHVGIARVRIRELEAEVRRLK